MSISKPQAFLANQLSYPEDKAYAAILGASPSKGARSPVLWNAAFAADGSDIQMLPMDLTPEKLSAVLDVLDGDADFLGGAVAVPYKERIAAWLGGRVTSEATAIGAVNCLFRGADGRLWGTNTDGEAALVSFENGFGSAAGKRVLLLGAGGAGKAVAAYFARVAKQAILCTRSEDAAAYAEKIGAQWLPWPRLSEGLADIDIVVNCTSLGFGDRAAETPLAADQLTRLPAHAIVFDIVYQPSPTRLLSLAQARGLQGLDGTGMNLEQAVLAYVYANPGAKPESVRETMMRAKNQLN